MKQPKNHRHFLRIQIIQRLFWMHFVEKRKEKLNQTNLFTYTNNKNIDSAQKKYILEMCDEIEENKEKIDKIISSITIKRPIEKIDNIDIEILRLAILEGFIKEYTPRKVIINEAINLSKEMSDDNSSKFINGILGNLIKQK